MLNTSEKIAAVPCVLVYEQVVDTIEEKRCTVHILALGPVCLSPSKLLPGDSHSLTETLIPLQQLSFPYRNSDLEIVKKD